MSSGLTSLSQPTFIQCLILHLSHTPTQISYPFFNPQYLFYLIQLSPHFDTQLFYLTPSPSPLTLLSHPIPLSNNTVTSNPTLSSYSHTPLSHIRSHFHTPLSYLTHNHSPLSHLTLTNLIPTPHFSHPSLNPLSNLLHSPHAHSKLSQFTLSPHSHISPHFSDLTLTSHFNTPLFLPHSFTSLSHLILTPPFSLALTSQHTLSTQYLTYPHTTNSHPTLSSHSLTSLSQPTLSPHSHTRLSHPTLTPHLYLTLFSL